MFLLVQAAELSGSGFCLVRVFTYLSVANPKTKETVTDMAKIAIKSEILTPWKYISNHGAIFIHSPLYY